MLKNALAMAVAAGMGWGGLHVAGLRRAPRLERVVCTGATAFTEADAYRWLSAHVPATMTDAAPEMLRAGLAAELPLADVVVSRRWPATLDIHLAERAPYATVIGEDGAVAVVDRDGRPVTLRRDQGVALWDRPAIRGCELPTSPHAIGPCVALGVGFLSWLDYHESSWLDELSEIVVRGDAVSVYLLNGLRVEFGTAPYGPKLKALRQGWGLVQRHGIPVEAVVLTSQGHVILNVRRDPAGGGPWKPNAAERRRDEV